MEEIKEEWKDIIGYENLYQVSSEGRVKSLERNVIKCRGGLYKVKEKILKSDKNNKDYLSVNLCKEGKKKHFLIHRLVAQAFIPNPNNLPQVNHRNEDKTNNRVDNLEWCDDKYNNNYGTRTERIVEKHKIKILQFALDGEFIKKWDSIITASKTLNISKSHISSCCKQKYGFKTAYGYKWGYANEYEQIPFNVFDIEIYKKVV